MCCAYIEQINTTKKVHTFASFINSTLLSMNIDPIRPYMDRIRICIAQSNSIARRSILAKNFFEFIFPSEKPQTIQNQCNREKKTLKSAWFHASTSRLKIDWLTIWRQSGFGTIDFWIYTWDWNQSWNLYFLNLIWILTSNSTFFQASFDGNRFPSK